MARERTLSLTGCVRWCHHARGLLMFRPDRVDASDVLVHLKLTAVEYGDEVDEKFRALLRPGTPITVTFYWQPDVDILAPWQPQEVVCECDEMFAAAPDPARQQAHLPRAARDAPLLESYLA